MIIEGYFLSVLKNISRRYLGWGGLVVNTSGSGSRGRAPLGSPCCVLEQDIFTPQKVLVIPRKWCLRPNMSEKLFTGTLSIKPKTKNLVKAPQQA